MSKNYDNWERLVESVLRREHDREIAMAPSRDPSVRSSASSSSFDHSFRSTFPFHRYPRDHPSLQVRKKPAWPSSKPFAWWRPREVLEENSSDLPAELDYPKVHLGHLKRFSLRELQIATDNFSNRNVVGGGGFRRVYKGRLADGSLIAVKRLGEARTQGGEIHDFHRIVEVLSQAVHHNILRLLGVCMTANERMLVHPYYPKGSVASCLRGRLENEPPLGWPTRKRIALGSARALSYLHDHFDTKIIHLDVKAANILLNGESEAVLGDFGLARLIDDRDHAVRGTIEHIAPEYLTTGISSEKNDVFGYGLMLLELITGQRTFDLARLAIDEDIMLLDWVKGLLKEKKLEILLGPDLQNKYVEAEAEELTKIALLCTQNDPMERPEMSEVVRVFVEGYGLATRWDELLEEEKRLQEMRFDRNNYDDTEDLGSIELSSPR